MSSLIAMVLFSLSMSISPGPVNMISLSVGVNYGLKASLSFITGATIGFTLLLFFIGIGLGTVVTEQSYLLLALSIFGSGFICFLGIKLASSTGKIQYQQGRIPSFYQGFLLQWLNSKAWIACLAGVSAFRLSSSFNQLLLFVFVYFFVCFFSITIWAFIGVKLKQRLNSVANLILFNRVMGSMLILVGVYLLYFQVMLLMGPTFFK